MSFTREEALNVHRIKRGKLEIRSKVPIATQKDLSLVYSPGVAEPCREIHREQAKAYEYTMKGNMVAIVTDGTAVLGLGDIGPEAALPVMEGKALLFKTFGDVDGFPICLNTKEVDQIVETVRLLEPTFGGINLEDISAPRCFEIEERLKRLLGIPVFHDDQHGTAIVTVAALVNALKLTGRTFEESSFVINGAGAAGVAIVHLLRQFGVTDIILCDTKGIIHEGRSEGMNKVKRSIAAVTNPRRKIGALAEAVRGADVFIGVSVEGVLPPEMVRSMNREPIIFAMANPVPEIMPDLALAAGARVIGTGRSDFPNQVNNVLAFPGVFRGALDVRASEINEAMKKAAVYAIAELVSEEELTEQYVIPSPLDERVAPAVAAAVALAARETGVAGC